MCAGNFSVKNFVKCLCIGITFNLEIIGITKSKPVIRNVWPVVYTYTYDIYLSSTHDDYLAVIINRRNCTYTYAICLNSFYVMDRLASTSTDQSSTVVIHRK